MDADLGWLAQVHERAANGPLNHVQALFGELRACGAVKGGREGLEC